MKTFLTLTAAGVLSAALAPAQTQHYKIIDVGTLPGGNFSQAAAVNNRGLVAGVATLADGTQRSMFWSLGLGLKTDLGVGGATTLNSGLFSINDTGVALGQVEASAKDPNNENFCGYGTGLKCLPFIWEGGVTKILPLLGGNNGTVGQVNNRGQAVGLAENNVKDSQCPGHPALNGTGPQTLDFEPVIWGPGPMEIHRLGLPAGDTVGIALGINDRGQAVGVTGTCANTIIPPLVGGPHAVLWETDGSLADLGNLGGTVNTAVPGNGNVGFSINNAGQVTGVSSLPGTNGGPSLSNHAFLWTKGAGMRDLGTLPGDLVSAGLAMNDGGDIVGGSIDAEGNSRPFLWRNGVMTDLNTLASDSPLYLIVCFSINSGGVIAGFGATEKGDIHGFLAVPHSDSAGATRKSLSPEVRALVRQRLQPGK